MLVFQGAAQAQPVALCARTIKADVVAFDQPLMFNRLGTGEPAGMIYALRGDVVPRTGTKLGPGNVQLRPTKRPRPIVLRANEGDCLQITFTNYLSSPQPDLPQPQPAPPTPTLNGSGAPQMNGLQVPGGGTDPVATQTHTMYAGVSVLGLELVKPGDGTYVGANQSSLIGPGDPPITYTYYAAHEGTNLLYSGGSIDATAPTPGTTQQTPGLFGAVTVEPQGSVWFRSQLSEADLTAVSTRNANPALPPTINYSAKDGRGAYLLRMLDDNNNLIHSDLTAVISGPIVNGQPTALTKQYPANPELPNRQQPFREFTIIYHEDFSAVQAFSAFNSPSTLPTNQPPINKVLTNSADVFAINYGTGGISAEVLANRLGTGPTKKCQECKFEEFFLSSWAQGDPATLVDLPANTNRPASKVFYPDDPSNVYHSYLNDHVRFRVLHGGQTIHHVHHLHAHQWVYEPNDSNSAYLDSQSIGPGSSYTMEIAYNGSGNLNRTVGDSIFHCHFYPHFASGMWALWRVHDVFEAGTQLDRNGVPRPGSRALPDSEIATGTPIPGLLPLPTLAMAPLPASVTIANGQMTSVGAGNPGFPFFIPGLAGHRPPHPPLDFAVDPTTRQELNGGLPRHVVKSGNGQVHELHTYQDFSKELQKLDAVRLPEDGTPVEKAAMKFHAEGQHASIQPNGQAASFLTNGQGPQPGAPYADPCMTLNGVKPSIVRYKGADLQTDVTINKKGWHVPQQRMIALWQDVAPTIAKQRAPEPLFFRANSQESCIEFWSTNLIPGNYALDDYQVRTPTDILGQHIHLVKFDVTSSDGGGNGWNYEDGTFSPDEVRERIAAINSFTGNKGLPWYDRPTSFTPVAPVAAPAVFGPAPNGQNWSGAQTTIQRWYADPVLNNQGQDRTLRTVFTHDHFGPSTHQQVGVYAGLLVEPRGSTWKSAVDGAAMHTRDDGGPTSFQAYIQAPNQAPYREFALEFQDVQLAYQAGPPVVGNGTTAINAPGNNDFKSKGKSLYPATAQPFPQIVSQNVGTASVNYRSEPLPYRTNADGRPAGNATDSSFAFASIMRNDPQLNWQHTIGATPPSGGGTAYYPPLTPAVGNFDPYTPLLRAYQGEKVQVRLLVGAHVLPHSFHLHGMPWLFEPSNANSGYRAQQTMGISEHFEMLLDVPSTPATQNDYLWQTDAKIQGLSSGSWGLLRAYNSGQRDMYPAAPPAGAKPTQVGCPGLSATPQVTTQPLPGPANVPTGTSVSCHRDANGDSATTCAVLQYQGLTWWPLSYRDNRTAVDLVGYASPNGPPVVQLAKAGTRYVYKITVDASARTVTLWGQGDRKVVVPWAELQPPADYRVTAISAADALASSSGAGQVTYFNQGFQIFDPDALLYVMDDDLVQSGGTYRLKPGAPVEPLALRAKAGQCVRVQLTNRFRPSQSVFTTAIDDPTGGAFSRGPLGSTPPTVTMPNISSNVGFHAQLVAYDMQTSDGANVGQNAVQTVAPGASRTYTWYAGKTSLDGNGNLVGTPVELGAVNLLAADPIGHPMHGLAAALIVEPAGATWKLDTGTRLQATVTPTVGAAFREFVAIAQDSLVLQDNLNIKIDPTQTAPEPSDSSRSFNYGTAPVTDRYGFNIVTSANPPGGTDASFIDYSCGESNALAMVWSCNAQGQCQWQSAEPAGPGKTPIFTAPPGMPVRFRMLKGYAGNPPSDSTGGASDDVITIQGHNWQDEPYVNSSTAIGNNPLSSWTGNRMGYVSASHFDMVIPKAGGPFSTQSDYWLRSYEQNAWMFGGMVGLFRVGTPPAGPAQSTCTVPSASPTLAVTRKKPPFRVTRNQIERALLLRSKVEPEGTPSPRLLKRLEAIRPAKRAP
ncbi:MAG TPA: hypothetical protein VFP84_09835 [Kofleriaceae bacterium]|nr:hypothetical protein [Kofleriaceae bacterium]